MSDNYKIATSLVEEYLKSLGIRWSFQNEINNYCKTYSLKQLKSLREEFISGSRIFHFGNVEKQLIISPYYFYDTESDKGIVNVNYSQTVWRMLHSWRGWEEFLYKQYGTNFLKNKLHILNCERQRLKDLGAISEARYVGSEIKQILGKYFRHNDNENFM